MAAFDTDCRAWLSFFWLTTWSVNTFWEVSIISPFGRSVSFNQTTIVWSCMNVTKQRNGAVSNVSRNGENQIPLLHMVSYTDIKTKALSLQPARHWNKLCLTRKGILALAVCFWLPFGIDFKFDARLVIYPKVASLIVGRDLGISMLNLLVSNLPMKIWRHLKTAFSIHFCFCIDLTELYLFQQHFNGFIHINVFLRRRQHPTLWSIQLNILGVKLLLLDCVLPPNP